MWSFSVGWQLFPSCVGILTIWAFHDWIFGQIFFWFLLYVSCLGMSTIALGELVNLVPGRLLFPHPGMGAMRPLVRRWRSMSRSFNVIRECQDRVDLRWIYKTILGLYLKIKSGRYNTPTCFSLPDKSACAQQVDFFICTYILTWN